MPKHEHEPKPAATTSDGVVWGFSGEHRFLSNFYSPGDLIVVAANKSLRTPAAAAPTVEHLYAAFACRSREDRAAVLAAPTAGKAKKRGKVSKHGEVQRRQDWDEVKVRVMAMLLAAKFDPSCRPELVQWLCGTAGSTLVEANSWEDTFWGVSKTTGSGQNNLGRALMDLRDGPLLHLR